MAKDGTRRGGARSGSGRKTRASTRLKQQFLARQHKAAEQAFDLVVRTMRGQANDLGLRVECAKLVMDRVYGKPKQALLLGLREETPGGTLEWTVKFSRPD